MRCNAMAHAFMERPFRCTLPSSSSKSETLGRLSMPPPSSALASSSSRSYAFSLYT